MLWCMELCNAVAFVPRMVKGWCKISPSPLPHKPHGISDSLCLLHRDLHCGGGRGWGQGRNFPVERLGVIPTLLDFESDILATPQPSVIHLCLTASQLLICLHLKSRWVCKSQKPRWTSRQTGGGMFQCTAAGRQGPNGKQREGKGTNPSCA